VQEKVQSETYMAVEEVQLPELGLQELVLIPDCTEPAHTQTPPVHYQGRVITNFYIYYSLFLL
jgi:hypothetical protein